MKPHLPDLEMMNQHIQHERSNFIVNNGSIKFDQKQVYSGTGTFPRPASNKNAPWEFQSNF
jgi:hypothetical protein